MQASSSTSGFFQKRPVIPPQYFEDQALQRIVSLHLPTPLPQVISDDLIRFSRLVLSKPILDHLADAEQNIPYLKPLNTFGEENKENPLVTSEGWRALQAIGIQEGIVGLGYEETNGTWNHRIRQYVKYYLWSGSSGLVTCPSAMTDGAACLLGHHLEDEENGKFFEKARERLLSRNPDFAWTSGQWMTERKGGSDVRGIETVAVKVGSEGETDGVDADGIPLGPWRIDGFKWFSSATDANMTILLAKTGPNGEISAFYAPLRRCVQHGTQEQTQLNGVRIQRLKNKLGTKPLPTAELEIRGMRGYLIGKEGQGVKEISTVLNITRMQNIVSSVGAWGRGLAISRAYARVRSVGGKLLCDVPAHVRGLAQEHVKFWAHMHLTYFIAALLGCTEGHDPSHGETASSALLPSDKESIKALYRVLTPMAKARTALAAISGLRACMESLGGVGYLENEDPELNIARIFRDSNVLAIWEGTTDIMADDLVRAVKGAGGPKALHSLEVWFAKSMVEGEKAGFGVECHKLRTLSTSVLSDLNFKGQEELKWRGRDYLQDLDLLVCGCLLMIDAARDKDEVVTEIAKRWIGASASSNESWNKQAYWDRKIVFGATFGRSML